MIKKKIGWSYQTFLIVSLVASASTHARIDVRNVGTGDAEFYDTDTGQTFTPRGYMWRATDNFIGEQGVGFNNGRDSFFDPEGDSSYSVRRNHIIAQLDAMSALGFNVVRVWTGVNTICRRPNDWGSGNWESYKLCRRPVTTSDEALYNANKLSSYFFANIRDFIDLAWNRGIRVYLSPHYKVPANFLPTFSQNNICADVTNPNVAGDAYHCAKAQYIWNEDLIEAQRKFHKEFIKHLIGVGDCSLPPLVGVEPQYNCYNTSYIDRLFAYEPAQEMAFAGAVKMNNERYVVSDTLPGNSGPVVFPPSGVNTALTQKTYWLGNEDNLVDHQNNGPRMRFKKDASFYFAEQLSQAVRSIAGAENILLSFSVGGFASWNVYTAYTDQTLTYDEDGEQIQGSFSWLRIDGVHDALMASTGAQGKAFLDIHMYPSQNQLDAGVPKTARAGTLEWNLDKQMRAKAIPDNNDGSNIGNFDDNAPRLDRDIPLIFGEYGADSSRGAHCDFTAANPNGGNTEAEAAACLAQEQADSCNNYNVKGWFQWIWEHPKDQTQGTSNPWYSSKTSSILDAMSPNVRPDPCNATIPGGDSGGGGDS